MRQERANQIQIVGCGEVGSAIRAVASKIYLVKVFDPAKGVTEEWESPSIAHVCIPFTYKAKKAFIKNLRHWCDIADVVILHSTVPVGTCDEIDRANLVYSPVRGRHENHGLAAGVRTFTKYVASRDKQAASAAIKFLQSLSVTVKKFPDYATLEAAKIFSTTYYGMCIRFAKLYKEYCDTHGLDFEQAYTEWNESYNKGYKELDESHFVRPVLKATPGAIGGHCIAQNLEFIPDFIIAREIKEYQRRLVGDE